jgi:hypothetical protein
MSVRVASQGEECRISVPSRPQIPWARAGGAKLLALGPSRPGRQSHWSWPGPPHDRTVLVGLVGGTDPVGTRPPAAGTSSTAVGASAMAAPSAFCRPGGGDAVVGLMAGVAPPALGGAGAGAGPGPDDAPSSVRGGGAARPRCRPGTALGSPHPGVPNVPGRGQRAVTKRQHEDTPERRRSPRGRVRTERQSQRVRPPGV